MQNMLAKAMDEYLKQVILYSRKEKKIKSFARFIRSVKSAAGFSLHSKSFNISVQVGTNALHSSFSRIAFSHFTMLSSEKAKHDSWRRWG